MTAMKVSVAVVLAVAAAMTPYAVATELPKDGLDQAIVQSGYEKVTPAIVLLSYSLEITNTNTGQVTKRDSNALGLVVSEDGLVLTHGHIQVDNRKPFNIRATINLLGDRKEYSAKLLEKPDDINVCFLQIEADEGDTFTPIAFSEGYEPSIGEPVLLLGILAESLDHVPAAMGRRIGAVLTEPRTAYCLSESVPFGYVGGPALNRAGDLIGVVGFDLSSSEGGDVYTRSGHPLMYQAELFADYIKDPPTDEAEDGESEDAWLGVFTQPLDADFAEYWGLPDEGGIVVATVIPGSPADIAGFRMGDVITSFDGRPVSAKQDRDVAAFTKLVRERPMGEDLEVIYYRDGDSVATTVTLAGRPKSARDAEEHEDDVFGFTVRELTRDVRILLNLSDDVEGVIVRKVESGSAANLAGVPPNALVMALNDRPVTSIDDFIAAVEELKREQTEEIAVLCRVGTRTGFFRMQPRWE